MHFPGSMTAKWYVSRLAECVHHITHDGMRQDPHRLCTECSLSIPRSGPERHMILIPDGTQSPHQTLVGCLGEITSTTDASCVLGGPEIGVWHSGVESGARLLRCPARHCCLSSEITTGDDAEAERDAGVWQMVRSVEYTGRGDPSCSDGSGGPQPFGRRLVAMAACWAPCGFSIMRHTPIAFSCLWRMARGLGIRQGGARQGE